MYHMAIRNEKDINTNMNYDEATERAKNPSGHFRIPEQIN